MSRKFLVAAVVAMSGFGLTACSASLSAQTSNDIAGTAITNTADATDVVSAVTNIDSKETLKAGERIKITAQDPWIIEQIQEQGTKGDSLQGIPAPGTQWRSAPLEPQQLVTVTATMRNPNSGQTMDVTRRVMSGPAADTFSAELSPEGGTYGVGIIPKITFDTAIPTSSRKAVTERIKVNVTPTPVEGSWHWVDSTTAAFRPAQSGKNTTFWPGHSKVTISADLTNVRVAGEESGKYIWGKGKVQTSFKTGRAMIITLNSDTKYGTATVDGKKARTFPISLGKSGFTTREGVKTIMEKYRFQRMTNQGVTTSEVYDLNVPYAMRLTDTGEFMHGAFWHNNFGYVNGSHGCSNLTMSDAEWFYNKTMYGDPVITKNTGRPMESWNGAGGLWNVKYSKWANS